MGWLEKFETRLLQAKFSITRLMENLLEIIIVLEDLRISNIQRVTLHKNLLKNNTIQEE